MKLATISGMLSALKAMKRRDEYSYNKGLNTMTGVRMVKINDWQNPRALKVGRRWVHLQITTSDCEADCHKCRERVAELKKALNKKPVLHSWTVRYGKNGGCWVRVLKVRDGNQLGFLRKTLSLKSIYYCTESVVSQSA